MEAADALNGYASGMPYPGFYQKIWEAICDKIEKPYEETVLSSIIATGPLFLYYFWRDNNVSTSA